MAALNTLRKKGGIFLSIVIGLALLAFLLGDSKFMASGNNVVVGIYNGEEIPYTTLNEKIEELTFATQFISGTNSLSSEETEAVATQAWQKLVLAKTFEEGTASLGLSVGKDEMNDMVAGTYVSPLLANMFPNQLGGVDKERLLDFIAYMDGEPTGNARKFWVYLEQEMKTGREMDKYLTLVQKGLFVTDLEVNNGVVAENDLYDLEYVSVSTAIVADSLVNKISDSELKDYYKKHLPRFKRSPFREIEYVSIETLPSADDYAEAEKQFSALVEEFKTATDAVQFVELNSDTKFDNRYLSKSMVPETFREHLFGAAAKEVMVADRAGDQMIAVKANDIRVLPDSLTIEVFAVPINENVDSIITRLKASQTTIAEVLSKYGLNNGGNLMTLSTSDITEESILKASKGDYVKLPSAEAISIAWIKNTGKPETKVQVAQLTYSVVPSAKTEQMIYAQATSLYENATAKGASFDKAVQEAGLVKRVATLGKDDRNLKDIKDSKEIVRWAFKAKKDEVSTIMSIGSSNYIAFLKDISEDEYLPFEKVKATLKDDYIAKKKTDYLQAEMAKEGSLDALAAKYNQEVRTAEGISFTAFYIPELGIAPEVLGAMTVVPQDKLSKPTPASSDVVVFKVLSKINTEKVDFPTEKALLNSISVNAFQGRVLSSLLMKNKIEDNRILYM